MNLNISPDTLFQWAGPLAMIGWVGLILTPVWPKRFSEWLPRTIFAIAIPAIIAALYTTLIALHWSGHPGGFDSLDAVMLLFSDRWLLLAGWIHYLAFDLFIGGWELADSRRLRVPHFVMVPLLLLTFFFGPIGLLAYLGLRTILRRNVAALPSID
jgi:hypothetical protein